MKLHPKPVRCWAVVFQCGDIAPNSVAKEPEDCYAGLESDRVNSRIQRVVVMTQSYYRKHFRNPPKGARRGKEKK